MTTSGTDPNLHRSGPQPFFEKLSHELNPGALIQQLAVGLTPDSIAMAIQIGHPYGRNPSASSSPSLEFPLYSLRGGAVEPEKAETPLTDLKNELINLLPQDLKASYLQEMQKNARDQSPAFTSLDKLIDGAAYGLIFLNGILKPANPDLENVNTHYLELPSNILSNLLAQSNDVTSNGVKFLQSEGRNLPSFDSLLSHLIEVKSLSTVLGGLLHTGSLEGGSPALNDVIGRLSLLKDNLNSKNFGSSFLVLKPLVENLYNTALSLSLGVGTNAHLISLSLANLETDQAGKGTSLAGDIVKAIAKNLSDGLSSSLLSDSSPAERELFYHLTTSYLTASLIASNAFGHNEAGEEATDIAREKNSKENETSDLLATQSAKLYLEQNLIQRIFFENGGKSALGTGLDATSSELIESSLELAALSLVNLSFGLRNDSQAEKFMQELEPQYNDRLALSENMLLGSLNSASTPEGIAQFASLLTEARLSINQGDYSAFKEAAYQALSMIGLDENKLNDELSSYKNIASLLNRSFSGELEDGAIQTGIVQI